MGGGGAFSRYGRLPDMLALAPRLQKFLRALLGNRSGVSRISFRGGGGGVQNIFEKVGVFAWQGHAFARGVRGMLP